MKSYLLNLLAAFSSLFLYVSFSFSLSLPFSFLSTSPFRTPQIFGITLLKRKVSIFLGIRVRFQKHFYSLNMKLPRKCIVTKQNLPAKLNGVDKST